MEWQIAVTALISALILMIEHYLPIVFGRKYHPTVNYILGVLALIGPLSALLAIWSYWMALIALWIVTMSGGLVVLLAYLVDHYFDIHRRLKAAELETQLLRPEVSHAEIDRNAN
jgi:hypothetical protein